MQGHVAGLLWPECSILLALLGSWARSGCWLLAGIREITGGESEARRPLLVAHGADKLASSGMEYPAAQQIEPGSAVHFALE